MPSSGTPSCSSATSHESRIEILVDRTDDVANVHALQRLARSCPTVLTVAVTPGGDLSASMILWALGKRKSTRWTDRSPDQHDADLWLRGYQIRELVILQAQHLPLDEPDRLRRWAEKLDITLGLLYCGAGGQVQPTTTIEAFLNRPRRPTIAAKPPPTWPGIEDVDLLDYRAQCFCQLSDAEYLRVDRAFHGSATRIHWFFDDSSRASRDELGKAISLATATQDGQLREILMKGALVGLLRHGRAIPNIPPPREPFVPQPISRQQLDEFREDINPERAAIRFLRHWTHLSDRRLSVIGPEQVTTTTIAGIDIPSEMHPTFRALITTRDNDRRWAPFEGGVWVSTRRWKAPETDLPIDEADKPAEEASYEDRPELLARILSGSLTRAHWAIAREKIPPALREDVQALRQRGILAGIYPNEYELTTKAVRDSSAVSATHVDVAANPEEVLLFLLKNHGRYEPLKYRDATTKQERRHSRLVRLIADLVQFGHISPYKTSGYLKEALESLRRSGYVANFGPIGYRLSERGVYSLCWDDWLPAYPEHPRDYNPPPTKRTPGEDHGI